MLHTGLLAQEWRLLICEVLLHSELFVVVVGVELHAVYRRRDNHKQLAIPFVARYIQWQLQVFILIILRFGD